jgi:hypothetical protein
MRAGFALFNAVLLYAADVQRTAKATANRFGLPELYCA